MASEHVLFEFFLVSAAKAVKAQYFCQVVADPKHPFGSRPVSKLQLGLPKKGFTGQQFRSLKFNE